MPVQKRRPKSQGYAIQTTRVDEHGRQYFVIVGALPDLPLGELADEAARDRALAEAAKPQRVYVSKWRNED